MIHTSLLLLLNNEGKDDEMGATGMLAEVWQRIEVLFRKRQGKKFLGRCRHRVKGIINLLAPGIIFLNFSTPCI